MIEIAVMGVIGYLFAKVIAWEKKYTNWQSPKIDYQEKKLPGLNCGVCGYTTCALYAAAIIDGEHTQDCTPLNEIAYRDTIVLRLEEDYKALEEASKEDESDEDE